MGFDKLFVDECHLYKNLGTATKMSNVAGIGTTGSGKAAELLMKTKYFDELTGGKGMAFASGTPVETGYLRSQMPILRCCNKDTNPFYLSEPSIQNGSNFIFIRLSFQ